MSLANNGKELKSSADVFVRTLEERGVLRMCLASAVDRSGARHCEISRQNTPSAEGNHG
jgi:hypothetical protein